MNKELQDLVYNYKTKYEEGFTDLEIKSLLIQLKIDEKSFYKLLGVNTCMKDNQIITYHSDVFKTFRAMRIID
jgi:hypothetical protein